MQITQNGFRKRTGKARTSLAITVTCSLFALGFSSGGIANPGMSNPTQCTTCGDESHHNTGQGTPQQGTSQQGPAVQPAGPSPEEMRQRAAGEAAKGTETGGGISVSSGGRPSENLSSQINAVSAAEAKAGECQSLRGNIQYHLSVIRAGQSDTVGLERLFAYYTAMSPAAIQAELAEIRFRKNEANSRYKRQGYEQRISFLEEILRLRDRYASGHDYQNAINESEFAKFVRDQQSLGRSEKEEGDRKIADYRGQMEALGCPDIP